jgi:predicted nucleotidyltransferase
MLKSDELLRILIDEGVDFVVIGGIAAIAHGSATITTDFDVAAPLTRENIEKILRAVGPYRPRFAQTLDKRPLAKTADELVGFKNLYILTDLGRLDILGAVEPLGSYAEVVRGSEPMKLYGKEVRVLSMDQLITVKAHVGRPKDKQVELELRAIRDKLRSGR